jgi:hypothetical protein
MMLKFSKLRTKIKQITIYQMTIKINGIINIHDIIMNSLDGNLRLQLGSSLIES